MENNSDISFGPAHPNESRTGADSGADTEPYERSAASPAESTSPPADGNSSFLARMVAGIGRLVAEGGRKSETKKSRRDSGSTESQGADDDGDVWHDSRDGSEIEGDLSDDDIQPESA